jgi:tetratricopeptide (TPR) repeat protein
VPASGLAAAAGGHNPYLSAAITLYGDLEFESALENLKKAEKQASSSMAEDVQINLYMGLILFELGDADGAQARFKRALALDEKVALPKAVSPKTAAAFEKARRDISKARSHNEPKDAAKTVEPEPAPTPPATAPTRSANPSAEVKAPEPEEESGFHGFTLAARGDLVAFRAAAAGGVTARLDGAWFGGALSVIAPQLATRLEGRFHPVELRIVEPYLAVGGTLFLPVGAVHQTTFGLRGALGVDLRLGHVRFFVDVAYERYLNQTEAYSSDVVLLGAGAGWCF